MDDARANKAAVASVATARELPSSFPDVVSGRSEANDAAAETNEAEAEASDAEASDAADAADAAEPAAAATASRLYRTTSFGLALSSCLSFVPFLDRKRGDEEEGGSEERGRGDVAAFARTPASRWALPTSASTDGGVCGGALRGERRTGDATLACDAVARCAYTEAAPTAAVRGGVVLVDLGVGPPARAGGVSPLSSTPDKTSARSSRAFFVPGVRVGGRASSISSSAPLWRMKSMASRVAGERGGAAPARVSTQTRPRDGWEASVETSSQMSLLLFCGVS